MRVLLMAYGSRGDVQPLAGLAARLQARGVRVRVCVPPDEENVDLFGSLGVPMAPFGRSVRELMATVKPSAEAGAQLAAELVAAHFETVGPAAEDCDAVLATGLLPAGARSVAEKHGIPYVFACYHPFSLPSAHYPPPVRPGMPLPADVTDNRTLWALDAKHFDTLYGPALNAHRVAIGLPPVDDVRDHVHTGRPWLAMDPVLGPWEDLPDGDVVQTGAWVLPDDRPLPAELLSFLDAGPPPVYVGFGSMPMAAQDTMRMAVDAVRAHGRRVLVSRGWADQELSGDHDDCFAIGETNLQALFGRVAAVVHRGGVGTTYTATRAGAPQVVVPQLPDEQRWGQRTVDLGVGVAEDSAPAFEALTTALATALAPETGARAKTVAGTIRTDGADVAAELLLDVAGR